MKNTINITIKKVRNSVEVTFGKDVTVLLSAAMAEHVALALKGAASMDKFREQELSEESDIDPQECFNQWLKLMKLGDTKGALRFADDYNKSQLNGALYAVAKVVDSLASSGYIEHPVGRIVGDDAILDGNRIRHFKSL